MLNRRFSQQIQQRIDNKTKPLGALGQLESLAHQLALIESQKADHAVNEIHVNKPTVIIFAGDHGIADEGVSIAPSAVTQQMVLNFLAGGAAINCFCRVNDVDLKIVDTGILLPVEQENDNLIVQRLGTRTENFSQKPAMPIETVREGIELGKSVVANIAAQGCNTVMFGEMGIGNTSSASAILAALSELDVDSCVGLGTGITPEQLAKKVSLVAQGVARCDSKDPLSVLSQVGGFEIVQMVGAFLGAYEAKTPVIVDGFIVTVAAYVAILLEPNCREYMIFAHKSQEHAHQFLLKELDAQPLLDLSLRLGEGTGAVLAVPLVRAAAEFYNNMASFEDAGVTV
ncbi:nicotinate-nucleotide--dimethylbenzimidazole phosphoribosyltransferase [Vibrio sp. 10N.261.55.A7]|uniref:nicotinate-nucleotide--dimethylbenzimidazole phosphoribosyltransferase n=1 Tax=Vibrio sp. 10N.261.55.A7 TaxID=1880851 RepID=UPI000C83B885|nr:nicotinate-nucleotide--dimethylbenzimidazole phosphoribosyltransferase [Vibrio sp. 10N.261.55.A7]PMJ89867.1 nicotinate-nucleotide--dimethylbenzimidazole phosphoribosyltransferase [Vibrio sp. 10N.261.55.A7]